MADGIYWETDGGLVELEHQDYSDRKEAILQDHVEDYPALLCGSEITPDEPREWLFIEQSSPIPKQDDGGKRWEVDHLFLDQDGIPTMVEVKRAVDTRVRREVVGQMLDYVSGATTFWKDDYLNSTYQEDCAAKDIDPTTALEEAFSTEIDPEEYWEDVNQNVRLGRIRMIFLADHINSHLRRIVEFLNQQLGDAEAYAIELEEYATPNGDAPEQTVFAPRLYGQTEQTRTKTSRYEGTITNEEEFFADIQHKLDSGEISETLAEGFQDLYEFAETLGETSINRTKNASFKLIVDEHQGDYSGNPGVFTANIKGDLQVWPAKFPLPDPDSDEPSPIDWTRDNFEEYKAAFADIVGDPEANDAPINLIADADNRERFKAVVEQFVARCKNAN